MSIKKLLGNMNIVLSIGRQVVSVNLDNDSKIIRMVSWFIRNSRREFLSGTEYYQDKFRKFAFEMKFEITANDLESHLI